MERNLERMKDDEKEEKGERLKRAREGMYVEVKKRSWKGEMEGKYRAMTRGRR